MSLTNFHSFFLETYGCHEPKRIILYVYFNADMDQDTD